MNCDVVMLAIRGTLLSLFFVLQSITRLFFWINVYASVCFLTGCSFKVVGNRDVFVRKMISSLERHLMLCFFSVLYRKAG